MRHQAWNPGGYRNHIHVNTALPPTGHTHVLSFPPEGLFGANLPLLLSKPMTLFVPLVSDFHLESNFLSLAFSKFVNYPLLL